MMRMYRSSVETPVARRSLFSLLFSLLLLLPLMLQGCSPALNWRETRADGSGIVAMFPCKPERHSRSVQVAGMSVRMEMLFCPADGATYALSFFDVTDALAVTAALKDLRQLAAAKLNVERPSVEAALVPGMTPHPLAGRVRAQGTRPDGAALLGRTMLFSKDLRVYQAQVIGETLSDEAVETFFSALDLPN